ncbi:MAG: DNA recombination protein RmuC [Candidatus Sabulitectum sp.]|nr:DNA recombination protein RmuC [Candidatus Sabulitectum sp.]
MNPLLFFVFGVVCFGAGWAIRALRAQRKTNEIVRLETELSSSRGRADECAKNREKLESDLESLRISERNNSGNLKAAEVKLVESEKFLQNMKSRLTVLQVNLQEKENHFLILKEKHDKLETSLDEKQKHFREQLKLLSDNREELKREFNRLATEIFENNGRKFKELNRDSIVNLLSPMEKEMKGFREKVESIHEKDIEQRAALKNELLNLQKLNRNITEQAHKLATALQSQKKMQGNWGEMVLENVLDSSGLRLGKDYAREVSFRTDKGHQRPDVILYLPGNKHIVIDAKTSLAAYTDFVNADDPTLAKAALSNHARAVGNRIKELADRDYFKIPELNSPEVVIMFIPIESAYVEALKFDPTLFQKALQNNVLVATPTTLLTSLNIVRQLWRFEEQTKHTKELASRAGIFYNKLRIFLESMQEIGRQIEKTQNIYHKAIGQLVDGKGNLIRKAAEFRELGVSVTRELPHALVDRANLELESGRSDLTPSAEK